MVSKRFLSFLTILFSAFLYTGFYFQQADIEGALDRTANSICGLLIVLLMCFFLLRNKHLISLKSSIVMRYVVAWIFLILLQTFITIDNLGRSLVNSYYVTIWPVSYLFFYTISSSACVLKEDVHKQFFILSIVTLLLYYMTAYASFSTTGINGSIGNSYYMLCFLPWVLIMPSKSRKYTLLALFVLTILVSSKRTSILAIVAITGVYFFMATKKYNLFVRLLIVGMVAVIMYYAFVYIDQSFLGGHITERFQYFDKGADTRENIWETVLLMYYNSPLSSQLLGHGYNAVITTNPLELSAHNDYIETLYDHGAIMLALQVVIILRLVILSYKLWRSNNIYFPSHLSSIVLYIIMSYLSHLILYPYYFCFLSAYWGFIEGQYVLINKEKEYA